MFATPLFYYMFPQLEAYVLPLLVYPFPIFSCSLLTRVLRGGLHIVPQEIQGEVRRNASCLTHTITRALIKHNLPDKRAACRGNSEASQSSGCYSHVSSSSSTSAPG